MEDGTTKSILVKAPVAQCFQIWSNFENFPHFMKNIKSVQYVGPNITHWVVDGPLGRSIEWDAETTLLEPDTRIAWNSTEGDIKTSGQVTFTELGEGDTQVTVMMKHVPPAGLVGTIVDKLFVNPAEQIEEDLRNFKAYAEGMTSRIDG